MIISTNNVRNFHQMVINNHSKIVSWVAIFLLDNPVTTDIATLELNFALDHVSPLVDTSFIDSQTNRRNDARCFALSDVGCLFFL